jgi:hypothetical protein
MYFQNYMAEYHVILEIHHVILESSNTEILLVALTVAAN